MRVCLFGTYNRRHSANLIYTAAIREAGHELIELHEPLWEQTRDKAAGYFRPLALARHGLMWSRAAFRLARRWSASGGASVAVIGFNGQLDILLLRLLCPRYGPRVVFAPLVSLTETLVEDRAVYRPGSLAARLLTALDRLCCLLADVVVVDTEEHRHYFVEELGVDPSRLLVCHLGADNEAFDPAACGQEPAEESEAADKLEVLYFGQYLPLHGLDVVVDAVGRLAAREDLRFVFIGTGPERDEIERLLRATRADVEFISWVAYEDLAQRIARADIVLGIFGRSAKARMVIPNKVYEAAALGKAVITAETPAVREVFEDDHELLLSAPDGESLAACIVRLAEDGEQRARLGLAAAELMRARFNSAALGRAWRLPLAGGEGLRLADRPQPLAGIAIVDSSGPAATVRCLESLAGCGYRNTRTLVVTAGTAAAEVGRLRAALAGGSAELLCLDEDRGYAGSANAALERLFAEGCDYVLLLDGDTIVTPQAVGSLVSCGERHAGCGPIGPRIADQWPGGPAASLGERYLRAVAYLPRALLRRRRQRQRSYEVSGVMRCALLVSRGLYEKIGGLDEDYFAHCEEIDYCLRARRAGARPRVEPMAEIAQRGLAGGASPLAAYLRARNLWRLGTRGQGMAATLAFAVGYFAVAGVSLAGCALRGRRRHLRALSRGIAAGVSGEVGKPPEWLFAASGQLTANVARGPS